MSTKQMAKTCHRQMARTIWGAVIPDWGRIPDWGKAHPLMSTSVIVFQPTG